MASPVDLRFYLPSGLVWKNTSDTPCPAHGLVQLVKHESSEIHGLYLLGKRPEGETVAFGLNGNHTVEPHKFGSLVRQDWFMVSYEDPDVTELSPGDLVGPQEDSWHGKKSR